MYARAGACVGVDTLPHAQPRWGHGIHAFAPMGQPPCKGVPGTPYLYL